MMGARAVIFGLAGPELLAEERAFFAESAPWGFVLFARNVESPAQLSSLTADLRDAAGRDVPVLIDQEGGRVARLGPPHWRRWQPVLRLFAKVDGGANEEAALEAIRLRYRIIAGELAAMGIDVDCVPLLDVPVPGSHDVIGERALGRSAGAVARRGRAVCCWPPTRGRGTRSPAFWPRRSPRCRPGRLKAPAQEARHPRTRSEGLSPTVGLPAGDPRVRREDDE